VDLDLSANGVTSSGAVSLARALGKPSCSVEELDLSKNLISDSGAVELARVLSTSSLRLLSLSQNKLGDGFVAALDAIYGIEGGYQGPEVSAAFTRRRPPARPSYSSYTRARTTHTQTRTVRIPSPPLLAKKTPPRLRRTLKGSSPPPSARFLTPATLSPPAPFSAKSFGSNAFTLKSLNLSGNRITLAGAGHLASFLRNSSFKLTEL
jgi:Leucine-rich repeat (LRR) protein